MFVRLLVSAMLSAMLMTSLVAWQAPTRDQAGEPIGHATLSGRIVDPKAPDVGIRRVDVVLSGGPLLGQRATRSDDAGRFVFEGLAAGAYQLRVAKTGYVPIRFGATKPGRAGLSIVLAAEDHRDLIVPMPRGAAISGTISDQTGTPLPGARVTVLRGQITAGVRVFTDVLAFAESDQRGAFRIASLDAGDYIVAATRSDFNRRAADFTRIAEGEVDLALRETGASIPVASLPRARNFGFAPVYYPSAASMEGATPITVALGEERTGVDLTLGVVPVARVDGVVTGGDGRPAAGVRVTLLPRGMVDDLTASQYAPGGLLVPTATDTAGHFVFSGVDPGDYSVRIDTSQRGRGAAPLPPNAVIEWARADFTVNGDDQTLAITLQPARSITGHFVFDGPDPPPADPSNFRISVRPAYVPLETDFAYTTTNGRVEADGRFVIPAVAPGSYWLSAVQPGPISATTWTLTSALIGGRDALDGDITIGDQADLTDVVLRFSDHPSGVEGTLQTSAGSPASDYFVVVFPKDQIYWKAHSRRIAMARPNSTGAFKARNLPPGDYLIAALTDVEDGDWFDPAFLRQLLPASREFTIQEGQTVRQDLKISK